MQTGALNQVRGLEGTNTFRFEGLTDGGRAVAVEVSPETVIALAEAMKHTDSVGHAAWHVQRNNARCL
jgi:hypothetical protein